MNNDEEFISYKNNILVNELINLTNIDNELRLISKEVLNIQNILDDSSFSLVALIKIIFYTQKKIKIQI